MQDSETSAYNMPMSPQPQRMKIVDQMQATGTISKHTSFNNVLAAMTTTNLIKKQ